MTDKRRFNNLLKSHTPPLILRMDHFYQVLNQHKWMLGPVISFSGMALLMLWNSEFSMDNELLSVYPALGALLLVTGIAVQFTDNAEIVALPVWYGFALQGFFTRREHYWLAEKCQEHQEINRLFKYLLDSHHPIPMTFMPRIWLKLQQLNK